MVKDHVERVRSAMLPLCEPFYDVFTWAEQLRRERLPELEDDSAYRWHATHTVRAFAHLGLSRPGTDLGGWSLSGNHAQNGALWLTDGSYRLRLLHVLNENDVPLPGSNRARQAYYRNPPLVEIVPLFGEINDRLLVLWRIEAKTGAPCFRVVRPIDGDTKWGGYQRTDLDFVLPETSDELAGLKFDPTDEELGLELPLADEEGGEDAGGVAG
jgi:hypothetical protein